tara:strand:+ start:3351 stop:3740 length:390 start_codon:yes stop_codon:yes gene_type:complete
MTEHRRGWFRSFYYFLNWEYDSDNDIPSEKDILLKQTLMRQVSLSKLKMNKARINPRKNPDLQPIITKEKIITKEPIITKEKITNIFNTLDTLNIIHEDKVEEVKHYCPPRSSPIEISQKQKTNKYGYR